MHVTAVPPLVIIAMITCTGLRGIYTFYLILLRYSLLLLIVLCIVIYYSTLHSTHIHATRTYTIPVHTCFINSEFKIIKLQQRCHLYNI